MDNAQFVERVRCLCKSQKTSLTKLEAELGFSNGYIGKWSKRPTSPPHDKLVEIANALGVTVEELTGEQKENPPQQLSKDGQDIVDYLTKRFDGMSEEDKKLEMNRIQSYIYSEIQKMI